MVIVGWSLCSLISLHEKLLKLSSLFRRYLRAARRMWNSALKVGHKCYNPWLFLCLYNFISSVYLSSFEIWTVNFFLLLPRQPWNRGSVFLEQLNNFNPGQNILGHLRKLGVKTHPLHLIKAWESCYKSSESHECSTCWQSSIAPRIFHRTIGKKRKI